MHCVVLTGRSKLRRKNSKPFITQFITLYDVAAIARLLRTFSNIAFFIIVVILNEECTNFGRQISVVTKLHTVAPNTSGPSVCNLLCVALLAPIE